MPGSQSVCNGHTPRAHSSVACTADRSQIQSRVNQEIVIHNYSSVGHCGIGRRGTYGIERRCIRCPCNLSSQTHVRCHRCTHAPAQSPIRVRTQTQSHCSFSLPHCCRSSFPTKCQIRGYLVTTRSGIIAIIVVRQIVQYHASSMRGLIATRGGIVATIVVRQTGKYHAPWHSVSPLSHSHVLLRVSLTHTVASPG